MTDEEIQAQARRELFRGLTKIPFMILQGIICWYLIKLLIFLY